MRENKLHITIDKPVKAVFDFTVNPNNTPLWIEGMAKEWISGPLEIGAKYTNQSKEGEINDYIVSELVPNQVFELKSLSSDYVVRYTYKAIGEDKTELEYFEWMESGELSNPFQISVLEKLKMAMEKE